MKPLRRPAHTIRAACLAGLAWVLLCVGVGTASAQGDPRVEIGFGGAIVSGAWNPVRVVARNAEPAFLEIALDQGSLREGEIPYRYRAELPGGSGLVTFADDVYLPPWRSATWRLATETRVLASGSFSARDVDPRPLHLVVSLRPGTWRPSYGDDVRVLERNGPDLPSRASAYDGVRTILVDGTTAPPRPEALLAAAGQGATVVLVGDLPGGYADIALLGSAGAQAYGNGRIVRVSEADVALALGAEPVVPSTAVRGALAEQLVFAPPQTLSTGAMLIASAAYAVLVLLALRFGGIPGAAAALALAVVASVAAWNGLRPPDTQFAATASLEISAGGIAEFHRVDRLASLPATTVAIDRAAVPVDRRAVRVTPDGASVDLARWGSVVLVAPERIGSPGLAWSDEAIVNRSAATLTDLWVVGRGPQGSLAPGHGRVPVAAEEGMPPLLYRALFPLLPVGTAVATRGSHVLVALPLEGSS